MVNMSMTAIPFVVGKLGTVRKGMGSELEALEIWRIIEMIQTTVLLRSLGMLRRFSRPEGDILSLKL